MPTCCVHPLVCNLCAEKKLAQAIPHQMMVSGSIEEQYRQVGELKGSFTRHVCPWFACAVLQKTSACTTQLGAGATLQLAVAGPQ